VSAKVPVNSGVPQRSVIGRLLFTIYMLDFPNGVSSSVVQYADDTSIYRVIRDQNNVDELPADLTSVGVWCEVNIMSMNVKKLFTRVTRVFVFFVFF
jgi:ribonuclease P/MRP protein subunit RPP40